MEALARAAAPWGAHRHSTATPIVEAVPPTGSGHPTPANAVVGSESQVLHRGAGGGAWAICSNIQGQPRSSSRLGDELRVAWVEALRRQAVGRGGPVFGNSQPKREILLTAIERRRERGGERGVRPARESHVFSDADLARVTHRRDKGFPGRTGRRPRRRAGDEDQNGARVLRRAAESNR